MTLSKSNIVVIVGTVIASVLACCHLLTLLFDTADAQLAEGMALYDRPWLVEQLSAPWLLPVALILFTVIIVFMGVKCRKYPEYGGERQSPVMGILSLLTTGVLGYTLVTGLISLTKAEPVVEVGPNGEVLEEAASSAAGLDWKICFGIGICGAVALAIIAIGFFTGSNMLNRMPMLMLMPIFWLGMRLVLTFLDLTSHASIAERSIELVMLVVMTLFMVSLGKFLAGVGGTSAKWASVYGGLTALYAFATGVSRLVLSMYGSKALDGSLAQISTETIESYGLQPNYGDLAIGLFAIVMLVNISIRQREEEDEMAFGRKRRRNEQEMPQQRPMQQNQNMYQQPWPAQQPSMYQQQQMQQNMYQQRQMQQNMMRQQQIQQQMQQNMYRQQMMQQQQMQQMQQNMYQQQMMQQNMMRQQNMNNNMNGMNGMGAMNNMNNMNGMNGYNADAQPVEAVQRQPEQRSVRHSRPQNRSRMPDSFEVRTYGGPSISTRKKFGGLDSFRDQMLSGQSALNMQSEELPPPPPPVVNITEEEAAMQAVLAASLAAEEVNTEINDLTDQIQRSVDSAPEGPKGAPSNDVELEIPDDDAVISVLDDDEPDDHADERDYPAPPPTRTVTLGSGKHQGTLTDRLAELEEYKRRDARRQRPQERYEEEYYDDYEEYADEYEEYEDDYDYEEYEYEDDYDAYDDGYDDEYDEYDDEYGEYDDEYEEYDDEYDEYDEYDDDYYDDEDDGYYEE